MRLQNKVWGGFADDNAILDHMNNSVDEVQENAGERKKESMERMERISRFKA